MGVVLEDCGSTGRPIAVVVTSTIQLTIVILPLPLSRLFSVRV
jgi:hypothetical protein